MVFAAESHKPISGVPLEVLHATRDYTSHHHTHLMFVRRVFLRMAPLGIAVIEHPRRATQPATTGSHHGPWTSAPWGPLPETNTARWRPSRRRPGWSLLDWVPRHAGAYYAHFVYGNATTEKATPASDVDMEESDAPPPEKTTTGDLLDGLDLPTNGAERNFGSGSAQQHSCTAAWDTRATVI